MTLALINNPNPKGETKREGIRVKPCKNDGGSDFSDGGGPLDLQTCSNGWWEREIALVPPMGVFLRRENVREMNEDGLTEGVSRAGLKGVEP